MSKTITIWECQDCGALYSKRTECWCCVDMEGQYTGKHESYVIKKLGKITAKDIKAINRKDK